MPKVNKIFAILVLLGLGQRHHVDATVRSFDKLHDFPQKQVMYDSYSFKEGNLVYAVCDGPAKEKSCTIMQEQYPDGKLLRSCDLSIKANQEDAEVTKDIYVVAFGKDNVILFWDEVGTETFFKLLIVKMDTCKISEFSRPDPLMSIYYQLRFNHKLLTYNDTFDIFIKDENKADETDNSESVTKMNALGTVLEGPNNFLKSDDLVRFISPIATLSPAKGYVYYKHSKNEFTPTIIKPDGSEKSLATYPDGNLLFMSANSDTITVCSKQTEGFSMACTQYDEDGNIKFNTTFSDDELKDQSLNTLHNSPRGGFLFMEKEYPKTSHYIHRVDGNGNKVGSVRLDDFISKFSNVGSMKTAHIWENGDNEFCTAMIGQGLNNKDLTRVQPSDLYITGYCFTEEDFKA